MLVITTSFPILGGSSTIVLSDFELTLHRLYMTLHRLYIDFTWTLHRLYIDFTNTDISKRRAWKTPLFGGMSLLLITTSFPILGGSSTIVLRDLFI